MAETLQQDLGKLALQSKSKLSSFLDVVGADVDSSFSDPLYCNIVQDTYHISMGGQTVGQNANIQIQLDDDNALQYLWKYAITADVYTTSADETTSLGSIQNAVSLFDGQDFSIGQLTWSCPYQKYYTQLKLAKMGADIREYSNGLALKYNGFAQQPHSDGALWVGSANNANAACQDIQLYCRQLVNQAQYRSDLDEAGHSRTRIYVPLPFIFPQLWQFPDDGCVYTGLGQKIKFNLRTTNASECVMSNGAGLPLFHMKNLSLIRFYSKLDAPRNDLILKSNVQLCQQKYIHWPANQMTSVVNCIFPISKDDRIKGLIFGCFTKIDAGNTADATNVIANLVNNTPAQFKAPLIYHPEIPIKIIDIEIGGRQYTINSSQMALIDLSSMFGDQKETYDFPLQRQTKFAYYLDLTRFGYNEDLFGSSSKSITSAVIKIEFKVGPNSRTLFDQPADWVDDDAAVDGSLKNFQFHAYLETQRMIECRNGMYQQI